MLLVRRKLRAGSNLPHRDPGFAQKLHDVGLSAVAAVYDAVNELQSSAIPLLASPQGGVAASSIRYCEATEAAAGGVVFLLVFDRKTSPASRSAEASRYFVTRSATLLAVMQGGEYARFQFVHTFYERRISGGHRPPLQC